MADVIFNQCYVELLSAGINFASDTIKAMLMKTSYVADIDTHEHYDDVSSEELAAGGGYTTGGETLTSKTVTKDDVNDLAKFDAADVPWAAATFSTIGAILYRDTGTPATSAVVCFLDFGGTVTVSGGTLTIIFHADGILQVKTD